MSKFGGFLAAVFLLFIIMGKIFFPFGDEPDFDRRVDRLYNDSALSFFLNDEAESELLNLKCTQSSSRPDISFSISTNCIDQNLSTFVDRIFYTLLVVSPLVLLMFFRRFFYYALKSNKHITYCDWNRRLDAISLTLIFPSAIYFLGLFSREVVTTAISLLLLLFWGRRLIVTAILLVIYYIDSGNAVPVIFFTITLLLYDLFSKKTYRPYLIALISFLIISFSYFFSDYLIFYIVQNFNFNKMNMLYNSIFLDGHHDKYPILLRSVITYISLVFMTAEGVKSLPLLIITTLFLLYLVAIGIFKKTKFILRSDKSYVLPVFAGITTIFFITITFPTHSYGKYYLFLLPFVAYALLFFYNKAYLAMIFIGFTILMFVAIILGYV
ncbi:hypothetical protein HOL24_00220 [bacterium]|nr:hypothetical protein [bacterium]